MKYLVFALQDAGLRDGQYQTYYVIEQFPYPQFVLDEDGLPKAFESYQAAKQEAYECQEGYIIVFE